MKTAWFTKIRLLIAGLAVIFITLVWYQSTLAQLLPRPTMDNCKFFVVEPARQEQLQRQFKDAQIAVDKARQFGKQDVRLSSALAYQASLFEQQMNFKAAEPLYKEALRIDESSVGSKNPALIPDLRGLARTLAYQSKISEAETILTRLLDIAQAHSVNDAKLAQDMTLLANIYIKEKKLDKAENLIKTSLELNKARFGPEALVVAVDLNNLAQVYVAQGREELAFDMWNRSVGLASKPQFALVNEANFVKVNYKQFWETLTNKYIANKPDQSLAFPHEAFSQAKVLREKRQLKEAESVLKNSLNAAVNAPNSKTDLAKYLVRLNNILFDEGKDEEALFWGTIASNILDRSTDPSLTPWKINVHSYLAMSLDRGAERNSAGKGIALKQSASNYEKAIALSGKTDVEEKWLSLIQGRMKSVKERQSLATGAKRAADIDRAVM